jgi:hypothetical protein
MAKFRVEKSLAPSGYGGFPLSPPMAYGPPMAMLPTMLEQDRKRAGWSVGQAAWRLGVSIREFREIEAGALSLAIDLEPVAVRMRCAIPPSVGQLLDEVEAPPSSIARNLSEDARAVEPLPRVDHREAHCFGLNVDV